MATTNGDIKTPETAQTFAKDYIHDLLDNINNSGAYEEETLDITIKSKYDDLVVDESEPESQTDDKPNTVDDNARKEAENEEKTFKVETAQLNEPETKEIVNEVSCVPEPTEQIPEMSQQNIVESDDKENHFVVHVVDNTKTLQEDDEDENEIPRNEQESAPLEPQANGSELVDQTKEVITIHLIGHDKNSIDTSAPLEPQTNGSELVEQITEHEKDTIDTSAPLEPQTNGSELVDQTTEVITTHLIGHDTNSIDTSAPLEPQTNGSELIEQTLQHEQNGTDTSDPLEPQENGSELVGQTPELVTFQLKADAEIEQNNRDEEDEEEDDVLPPILQSRMTKTIEPDELKLNKIGINDNLWASKQASAVSDQDESVPFDKFRTIKQNIKRGNTRSLKERFENFGKF